MVTVVHKQMHFGIPTACGPVATRYILLRADTL